MNAPREGKNIWNGAWGSIPTWDLDTHSVWAQLWVWVLWDRLGISWIELGWVLAVQVIFYDGISAGEFQIIEPCKIIEGTRKGKIRQAQRLMRPQWMGSKCNQFELCVSIYPFQNSSWHREQKARLIILVLSQNNICINVDTFAIESRKVCQGFH